MNYANRYINIGKFEVSYRVNEYGDISVNKIFNDDYSSSDYDKFKVFDSFKEYSFYERMLENTTFLFDFYKVFLEKIRNETNGDNFRIYKAIYLKFPDDKDGEYLKSFLKKDFIINRNTPFDILVFFCKDVKEAKNIKKSNNQNQNQTITLNQYINDFLLEIDTEQIKEIENYLAAFGVNS